MTRMTASEETGREALENVMALIAGGLSLLDLVEIRAEQAARQLPALMDPATKDIRTARRKFSRAQESLGNLWQGEIWKDDGSDDPFGFADIARKIGNVMSGKP